MPYADNGILLTPVAVDARMGQGSRTDDFLLLRFFAGPVERLPLPRYLDREENVGNIVVMACIGARHTRVAQIVVYKGKRSAYSHKA